MRSGRRQRYEPIGASIPTLPVLSIRLRQLAFTSLLVAVGYGIWLIFTTIDLNQVQNDILNLNSTSVDAVDMVQDALDTLNTSSTMMNQMVKDALDTLNTTSMMVDENIQTELDNAVQVLNDTSNDIIDQLESEISKLEQQLVSLRNTTDEFIVYVHINTGDDANNGLSQDNAVQTFGRGLEIMEQQANAKICILDLDGTANYFFDDGEVIDFSKLVEHCQKVILRGQKNIDVEDTVVSLTPIHPYEAWDRISLTTGGLNSSDYLGYIMENVDRSRYYVVRDNAVGTIDTIAGVVDDIQGFDLDGESFSPGDTIRLYFPTTRFSFRGNVKLIVPESDEFLVFQALSVRAFDSSSVLESPVGIGRHVRFQGCDMRVLATSRPGSFTGSMLLEGVYIAGSGTTFNARQQDVRLRAISIWSEGIGIEWTGIGYCYFAYFNSGPFLSIETSVGLFIGYGIHINAPANWGILMANAQLAQLYRCRVTNLGAGQRGIFWRTGSGIMRSVEVAGSTSATGIWIGQALVRLGGQYGDSEISTGRGMFIEDVGQVSIFGTNMSPTNVGIQAQGASLVSILSGFGGVTITGSGSAQGVQILEASKVAVQSGGLTIPQEPASFLDQEASSLPI